MGVPLADHIGDVIFTVKINPNMARNANVYGVAREIAALTGQKLKPMSFDVIQNGATLKGNLNIEIKESELNPRFTAMLIRDVKDRAVAVLDAETVKVGGHETDQQYRGHHELRDARNRSAASCL